MSNRKSLLAAAIALACSVSFSTHVAAEESRKIEIPAGDLRVALETLARQAGIELVYRMDHVNGVRTKGVSGELAPRDAAQRLLEGTPLELRVDPSGAMLISVPGEKDGGAAPQDKRLTGVRATSALQEGSGEHRLQLVQAISTNLADAQERREEAEPTQARANANPVELEEVVVTGSHIRGAQNLSSPVITFDRVDIQRTGYATAQQLIQSLPQNLNSISDSTFGAGNGGVEQSKAYDASGVNLRGLGGSSTLVLLNGRRMAAVGDGSVVDISLIPVGAIERMEVLTDGASAIYGSDAVGGVVNLVLRTDFTGAETRLRYGSVTEGSQHEVQAGQMFGQSWGSGQALLSYDYYDRSPLRAEDRDFIDYPSYEPIPELKRHSALATVKQRLSDRVEVSGDVFFGQRTSETSYVLGGLLYQLGIEVRQLRGALSLSADLPRNWQLRVSGTGNESRSEMAVNYVDYDLTVDYENRMRLATVDLAADGPLATLPGGEVRLALGGQFRAERFSDAGDDMPMSAKREINAAYGELSVPVVGAANRRNGIHRVDLTLAARYEEYADFASTFNPKLGLSWAPMSGLNIRGTWGTSFKAPMLSSMDRSGMRVYVREEAIVDEFGLASLAEVYGSGVNLQPEEAETWTVGFDWSPAELSGLKFAATYFSTIYKDRIQTPIPLEETLASVIANPLYSSVVTRNPSLSDVQSLYQLRHVQCVSVSTTACVPPEQVRYIVDYRLRNIAATYSSGLDFSVAHDWDTAIGTWSAQLAGTYLLENDTQLIPGAPRQDQLNQVWYPVDLRMRGGLSFTKDALGVNVFVNYTDSYEDNRTGFAGEGQRSSVASWTTTDLTLQYDMLGLARSLGLENAKLGLSVINLFDRDPPYISSYYNINFDGVNANAQGRFIAAQIAMQW